MNYIREYIREIRSGRCIVSERVRKVYEKLDQETEDPSGKYIFNEKKATRPIEFIERFCRNSKSEWAGKPITLMLFQKAYIQALFGFVDAETGLRRFRESLLYMARKNGKSTLLAGIALYMLIGDKEAGAEVYSIASKRDQAKLIFDEACNMVKQSPDLIQIVKKRKSDLYFGLTFSSMKPLGKNSNTLDGLNSSCVIIDELHAVKDRNTYEVMRQSMSAREQPLLCMITTAGTQRETIFDDILKYARDVADGVIQDDSFLPILYELDNKKEWLDPLKWEKANPALGTVKKIDDLILKVERAKNSPKDLSGLLCKDFNVIQTITSAWLTFDQINNEETFGPDQFEDCYCIGGVDLSLTTDLTCATLLFLDKNEKKYVSQMYFLPRDNFEKRVEEEKIPYDKWYELGLLRLCNGNTINPSDVVSWFNEMMSTYKILPAYIGYDSWSSRYFVEEMELNGYRMERVIQGAKTLSIPMQQLGADLTAKRIIYNNNPILKWCLTNTGVQEDRNGNIVPIKATSAKYRIDGTASLLDAYTILMSRYQEMLNLAK